jgi:hypothetical protein
MAPRKVGCVMDQFSDLTTCSVIHTRNPPLFSFSAHFVRGGRRFGGGGTGVRFERMECGLSAELIDHLH